MFSCEMNNLYFLTQNRIIVIDYLYRTKKDNLPRFESQKISRSRVFTKKDTSCHKKNNSKNYQKKKVLKFSITFLINSYCYFFKTSCINLKNTCS